MSSEKICTAYISPHTSVLSLTDASVEHSTSASSTTDQCHLNNDKDETEGGLQGWLCVVGAWVELLTITHNDYHGDDIFSATRFLIQFCGFGQVSKK